MRCPCHCRLKTALVVAGDHALWREAVAGTPFGDDLVKDAWSYLGITVAGPCGMRGGAWEAADLQVVCRDSWPADVSPAELSLWRLAPAPPVAALLLGMLT